MSNGRYFLADPPNRLSRLRKRIRGIPRKGRAKQIHKRAAPVIQHVFWWHLRQNTSGCWCVASPLRAFLDNGSKNWRLFLANVDLIARSGCTKTNTARWIAAKIIEICCGGSHMVRRWCCFRHQIEEGMPSRLLPTWVGEVSIEIHHHSLASLYYLELGLAYCKIKFR